MKMKTIALLAAAALASAPAFAHGKDCKDESKKADKAGAQADAPSSFASKPAAGTMAKCPVTGEVFKIGEKTRFAEHGGRWYAFCCPGCGNDFAKDPAKYAK